MNGYNNVDKKAATNICAIFFIVLLLNYFFLMFLLDFQFKLKSKNM